MEGATVAPHDAAAQAQLQRMDEEISQFLLEIVGARLFNAMRDELHSMAGGGDALVNLMAETAAESGEFLLKPDCPPFDGAQTATPVLGHTQASRAVRAFRQRCLNDCAKLTEMLGSKCRALILQAKAIFPDARLELLTKRFVKFGRVVFAEDLVHGAVEQELKAASECRLDAAGQLSSNSHASASLNTVLPPLSKQSNGGGHTDSFAAPSSPKQGSTDTHAAE